MGWVEDRFVEREAYAQGVHALWNEVRDSMGRSKTEFNRLTANTRHVLNTSDCHARGAFCLRVSRTPTEAATLELFLDEGGRFLKSSTGSGQPDVTVCAFRIAEDRSRLEFYVEGEGTISADRACERAASSFLFTPFPM